MKGDLSMKRFARTLLTFIMVITLSVSFALPANAATQAKFNSGKYCEVRISQSLINKKGKQYASVKLKTHSQFPSSWNSGGKVTVTMRDQYGRYIWSGQVKGGTTLKLGDDHSVYRIYVNVYNEPVHGSIWKRTIANANNFDNLGKCVSWSFSNSKNCTIR